jgi:hypothetical protein
VLSLKENGLGTKEAGKVLGEMLKANSVLKELDLSSNFVHPMDGGDAPGFAQELAVGIKDNGALLVLSVKSNSLGPAGGKALAEGLKGNQVITELNIADNYLAVGGDVSGVIALADAIPDMRAMTKLNVSDNKIVGTEGGQILSGMIAQNSVLKELDVSSNCKSREDDGPGFAKKLAIGISDNGAKSYEAITKESLVAFYTEHNPDNLGHVDKLLQHYSVREMKDAMQKKYGNIPDVTVISKSKGALIKLDISSNCIGAKHKEALQLICMASGIELAM